METAENKTEFRREKISLSQAIENALNKSNERDRVLSIIDCIRGYKNEFDAEFEQQKREGFDKCIEGIKSQREKVKKMVIEIYAKRNNRE